MHWIYFALLSVFIFASVDDFIWKINADFMSPFSLSIYAYIKLMWLSLIPLKHACHNSYVCLDNDNCMHMSLAMHVYACMLGCPNTRVWLPARNWQAPDPSSYYHMQKVCHEPSAVPELIWFGYEIYHRCSSSLSRPGCQRLQTKDSSPTHIKTKKLKLTDCSRLFAKITHH